MRCYENDDIWGIPSDIVFCTAEQDACVFEVALGYNWWRRYCAEIGDFIEYGCTSTTEELGVNATTCYCNSTKCNGYPQLAIKGLNFTRETGLVYISLK